MKRKEFEEIKEKYEKRRERLSNLGIGDVVYEPELADPLGFSYFKHYITKIDIDEDVIYTKDDQGDKHELRHFYLPSEVGLPADTYED